MSPHEAGQVFLDLVKAGAVRTVGVEPPADAPRVEIPLLNRCHCGKVISPTRACCRACLDEQILQAAEHIRTTAELEDLLSQFDEPDRAGIEALVKPIMMRRWETEQVSCP